MREQKPHVLISRSVGNGRTVYSACWSEKHDGEDVDASGPTEEAARKALATKLKALGIALS